MIERQLDIKTRDGATTTFFIVHPERDGPHPVILFFMDAPAIREELRDMARRFASGGYYVMLPNLYYRAGVMEIGPLADAGARERMFELMNGLTIDDGDGGRRRAARLHRRRSGGARRARWAPSATA